MPTYVDFDLPAIASSSNQQPRVLPPGSLPQFTSSHPPDLHLPPQQQDEPVPDTDLPVLDSDLQDIGVSYNIKNKNGDPSQIYLRGAGHWKPVDSRNHCKLTIESEVHVSARQGHGRFKSVELKVKLRDIPDKGLEYDPRDEEADKTQCPYEKTLGGSLGLTAKAVQVAALSGTYKGTHNHEPHATCKGRLEQGSLVRWTINENDCKAEGVSWYPQWCNPTITVKVPKDILRKITIGYQITYDFKYKSWWRFGKNAEHDFKWISYNLEQSRKIEGIGNGSLGKERERE